MNKIFSPTKVQQKYEILSRLSVPAIEPKPLKEAEGKARRLIVNTSAKLKSRGKGPKTYLRR